jgi:hypothetical protein
MSPLSTFTTISNKQSRMVLSHDQLFAQLAASTKLEFTSAAIVRLERSSIQWLNSIWKYVESKPDLWRATVTSPNTAIGTGSNRLALEIRPIHKFMRRH